MRVAILALAALSLTASVADAQPRRQPGELRCGWLSNPTPGNYWLTDRDGEWTIRTQGPDDGPPGWDEAPDMSTRGWVRTNGNYGYGCGCIRMDVSRADRRVTRVYSARPVPLAQCQRDRNLPRPG